MRKLYKDIYTIIHHENEVLKNLCSLQKDLFWLFRLNTNVMYILCTFHVQKFGLLYKRKAQRCT